MNKPKKKPTFMSNLEAVLQFAGILENQEAEALQDMIVLEFSKIEGDW